VSDDAVLVVWAVVAIAAIVALISRAKLHPFLALLAGAGVVGFGAGLPATAVVGGFEKGFGTTLGGTGILVALGTMLGKLLAASGGADRIVDTILARAPARRLPWAMAIVAMVVGIPLFFEVGVVLLLPVIFLTARRAQRSVVGVGIPALAGLSVMHGLVAPHPGPLIAIAALHADLGTTMVLGIVVAIPTLIVAGPLFGTWVGARVAPTPPPHLEQQLARTEHAHGSAAARVPGRSSRFGHAHGSAAARVPGRSSRFGHAHGSAAARVPGRSSRFGHANPPSFAVTLATILLPVVLMLARAVAEVVLAPGAPRDVLELLGEPVVAMLLAVIVASFTFGYLRGDPPAIVTREIAESLEPIAGILLIIGGGGGFKQLLVDSGVGDVIARAAIGSQLSPLVVGWLIAVGIRLATGSATVATVTASGLMAPIAASLPGTNTSLLALAIGAGSLFLSHVNDAGFWMVKEYFGMSIAQTFATWSAMETLLSVVALGLILALSAFV
jgi:gluconate:H+ symporter, GntP family